MFYCRKTVEFARQMEACGISFIAIHGRTKNQRSEPVDYETISLIKSSLNIPVVANGDIKSLKDANDVYEKTGVDGNSLNIYSIFNVLHYKISLSGVMTARGILSNPAMFSGYEYTPLECLKKWINISIETGTQFSCFHNHLIYMMDRMQSRADRKYFNSLGSTPAVIDFLNEKYNLNISY